MSKQIIFVVFVLFVGVLGGCRSQAQSSTEIEAVQQQLDAIEARLDELTQSSDISDLHTRITALEEKLNTLETTSGDNVAASHESHSAEDEAPDQMFQVAVAAYLLDTAGFHDMDERINEEGTILPGDAGLVHRVNRALAATDWPKGLEAKAGQLMGILEKYAEALSDDDVEAAKPLAAEAHDVQHELSHAVEKWLVGGAGHGEMEHTHDQEAAHVDHSSHHGGLLGMSGDLHLEIVSEKVGEYQIYLSDAFRQPINPEGVSGILVLSPGTDHEEELPLQVMHSEYLAASGSPTEVDSLDVSIRLDGTPEGHVEMDFTLSYEEGHEHQHEEQGEHQHEHGG